jgi:hypothetical protein
VRVIDHIANLKLSDEQEKGQFNELRSLAYLATGLRFLYEQVQSVEAEVIKRLPKDKRISIFGDAPEMQGINQDLVACAFHWYAVTVCNYVKMVGWLANNGNSSGARDYMQCVLPQVYLWRHKVAAHFAIIDPRSGDNAADLAMSVMFPISFDNDAFYTGSLTLTITKDGRQNRSRQDMRWSLTHTHSDLIPRYWPG